MPPRSAISAKPMPPAARAAAPAAHGRARSVYACGELPWGAPRVRVGRNPRSYAQGATGRKSPLARCHR
jgi:hypothetical protein